MRLTRSTKDRNKGCAYDPGALNKQGAIKNQTLRYVISKMTTLIPGLLYYYSYWSHNLIEAFCKTFMPHTSYYARISITVSEKYIAVKYFL